MKKILNGILILFISFNVFGEENKGMDEIVNYSKNKNSMNGLPPLPPPPPILNTISSPSIVSDKKISFKTTIIFNERNIKKATVSLNGDFITLKIGDFIGDYQVLEIEEEKIYLKHKKDKKQSKVVLDKFNSIDLK